ncbi:DUF3631 domain-containing protein [Brachybacterium sp. p3-SID957]|uniref:DUF3631 domain-containing protein n=1 Tax=Brachybacterium sp. p3-SID957 TaxID=2916049 RepID=UPI00223B4294|nr:DUF3631 domain-containing protein [Brachybacterium sp. p3-SID957]MCT1776763.1 DUF3631 domain-containing protein [Brachybacterium sp. p3-SID957]
MSRPYLNPSDDAELREVTAKYADPAKVTDTSVTASAGVTDSEALTSTVTPVTEVTSLPRGEGEATLDALHTFLSRFIAYPTPETADAHALWIVHAHVVDQFENTPRIAFLSPEPGSGKSRCMELTEALVPRPVLSVNATPAYIFRKISDDAGLPTLLIDECDAIFTGGKTDSSEELRGLLNSGYRKGATAGRVAVKGKELVTEDWPSFSAVALAGLNTLPDTIMTRAVVVPMKRRRRDQTVEPYRRRLIGPEADELRARIGAWADAMRPYIGGQWPDLPESIQDRDADVWEPLIAIADDAGGKWPARARSAALSILKASQDKGVSLGIRLLSDIRDVFTEERLSSVELVARLVALEDAPWPSIHGEELTPRFAARLLSKYEIGPTTLKIGGRSVKGFKRSMFGDAWSRYLPPLASAERGNSGNPDNPAGHRPESGYPGTDGYPNIGNPDSLICPNCLETDCDGTCQEDQR